jgi:hypothetical protein
VNSRALIAVLLVFWLAFGPAASAWAKSADKPCESMSMSLPADGCCGDGMDQAECLSACLAASSGMAAPAAPVCAAAVAAAVVGAPSFRHASILAPPDIAPPKPFVS